MDGNWRTNAPKNVARTTSPKPPTEKHVDVNKAELKAETKPTQEAAAEGEKPVKKLWQARGKKPVIEMKQNTDKEKEKEKKETEQEPEKKDDSIYGNWRNQKPEEEGKKFKARGKSEEVSEEEIQPTLMKWEKPKLFLHELPTGGEYQSRKGKTKTATHWGQRKLLLSELQFMLRAKNTPGVTVLYAGAAPGIHMPWIAKKFEKVVKKWILVDPADFDAKCHECAEIINNFFTEATAWRIRRQTMETKGLALLTEVASGVADTLDKERDRVRTGRVSNIEQSEMRSDTVHRQCATPALNKLVEFESSKHPLFFISDIRTGSVQEGGGKEFEDEVKRNMDDQSRWCKIMNPEVSMLKFRLPYMRYEHKGVVYEHPERTTEYLEGDVQLQIWAPQTSTETRLIVTKNARDITWDNKLYEDQMYQFNTVIRQQHHYNHNVHRSSGLDHRWDSRAEVDLLMEYVQWANDIPEDEPPDMALVQDLSKEINAALGKTFDQQLGYMDKHFMSTANTAGWGKQATSILANCNRERSRAVWWKNMV